jgi:ferredoxin
MALKITDVCIACAACEVDCPNDAISRGEGIYVIDPGRCKECLPDYDSPRCVATCPVDGIVPDPEHPRKE